MKEEIKTEGKKIYPLPMIGGKGIGVKGKKEERLINDYS
tara:strand:+ start:398 stop:514 length:117 start_codon:yes stop_codon:yes gene_type:complete